MLTSFGRDASEDDIVLVLLGHAFDEGLVMQELVNELIPQLKTRIRRLTWRRTGWDFATSPMQI